MALYETGNGDLRGKAGFEAFQPPTGKGAMDGAGRLKGRPGIRRQDVAEWKAKPAAPEGVERANLEMALYETGNGDLRERLVI